MTRTNLVTCLILVTFAVLVGCGESVNYEETKQKTDSDTKEYLLQVSGMT